VGAGAFFGPESQPLSSSIAAPVTARRVLFNLQGLSKVTPSILDRDARAGGCSDSACLQFVTGAYSLAQKQILITDEHS
jgi:hypothetical protein